MDYTTKAIQYAELYVIIDYKVTNNKMIYYANYPSYLSEPNRTYKVTVNLDIMKEESRTQIYKKNQ